MALWKGQKYPDTTRDNVWCQCKALHMGLTQLVTPNSSMGRQHTRTCQLNSTALQPQANAPVSHAMVG